MFDENNMPQKVLLVFLPEKNTTVEKFRGFYLPKIMKNPTQIAEYYKDIPIRYETLVFNNGVVEHTFSIYRDYSGRNIYYLVQNHPLSFIPTHSIFENPNVGLYYNTNKIISEYLYSIVGELKKNIEKENFDAVYIYRFQMIPDQKNYFKYAVTSNLLGIIPKKIGFFQGEPVVANFQIKDSTHSLNFLLFSMLEKNKALIDFYFSYLNIFRYYDRYPVKVMNPDEFLDKVFNEIRSLYIPQNENPLTQPQFEETEQNENQLNNMPV